jgi:hypothetical protein
MAWGSKRHTPGCEAIGDFAVCESEGGAAFVNSSGLLISNRIDERDADNGKIARMAADGIF